LTSKNVTLIIRSVENGIKLGSLREKPNSDNIKPINHSPVSENENFLKLRRKG
jgi:hypothetical protein